jgi:hypothetical protein
MPKKKGQQWDFKAGATTPRAALRRAIYGDCDCREMFWAIILSLNEADLTPLFVKAAKTVGEEMRIAARAGDTAAFERLARCVAFLSNDPSARKWADPLAAQIISFAGGALGSVFNIELFMRKTGCTADRETIRKRVRALGYRYQQGRPKKVGN